MAPATPAESSPIPSDAPPPVVEVTVAAITFGRDRTLGSDTVSIVDRGSEFAGGREIAWRVELPPAAGNELIRVTVEEIASGAITVDESFTPEAGWNVFYGKTVLADQPGTYVMRYFVDGIVLGEGQFTIREAVVDAATPRPDAPDRTPKPQPRPTPKPDRTPEPPPEPDRDCDPSYPTLCLRSSPDLDCPEINARNVPVRGRDPHGFDGDGDGVGCES